MLENLVPAPRATRVQDRVLPRICERSYARLVVESSVSDSISFISPVTLLFSEYLQVIYYHSFYILEHKFLPLLSFEQEQPYLQSTKMHLIFFVHSHLL